jgi:hypothetical protein
MEQLCKYETRRGDKVHTFLTLALGGGEHQKYIVIML